jgi:hypothetical protein
MIWKVTNPTKVPNLWGCGEMVSQQTFNLPISGSSPGAPTIREHITTVAGESPTPKVKTK